MQQRERSECRSECRSSWLHTGHWALNSPALLQEHPLGTAALSTWNRDSPSAMTDPGFIKHQALAQGFLLPWVLSFFLTGGGLTPPNRKLAKRGWVQGVPVLFVYLKNRTIPRRGIRRISFTLARAVFGHVYLHNEPWALLPVPLGDFLLLRLCKVFSTRINLLT